MSQHIYFSGVGGSGIGPLALLAHQAGYQVSGSDGKQSAAIEYLVSKGIANIHIGQSTDAIAAIHATSPIDWFVYSSAVEKENPNHPELVYVRDNDIHMSKRDDFINKILDDSSQKMIAVAGTHGKTTTTAMTIWLFKTLGIPISYLLGGKVSFGDPGEFDPKAEYFIYEADEYDRNFLSFNPVLSIIPGIAYDHPDIYPTVEDYNQAFLDFFKQSDLTVLWQEDAERLKLSDSTDKLLIMRKEDYSTIAAKLPGDVNRENASLAVQGAMQLIKQDDIMKLSTIMDQFPGLSRRFEVIADNIYSDYAHTPEKIIGALQLAHEVAGDNVVVIYEGLHNTRQHFIKPQLETLFNGVKKLFIVPSYLAREDESLEMLTPEKLCAIVQAPEFREPAMLDLHLKSQISDLAAEGNLILCLTAGGAGSLDEWLRLQDF
jgi:UDP-N-acetylmuramate--alanine ligase